MSKHADNPFLDRLKKAADHARVPFSQAAIGNRMCGVNRRTVDRWFNSGGEPSIAMLFKLAEALGVDAKWLGTGDGAMLPDGRGEELAAHEQILLDQYRLADPRWKLSLRLLASLANEDQIEAATDVDMVVARLLGKKPHEIKYVGDKEAGDAIGKAPHVKDRDVAGQKK